MNNHLNAESILAAAGSGIIATDINGRIVFINEMAVTILDLDRDATIGAHLRDVLPKTYHLVLESMATGDRLLDHPIAEKTHILLMDVTLVKKGRQILGAVCAFQRGDQFELAAQKLESYKDLNQQLNTILDAISEGVWVCSNTGVVQRINKVAERLIGIKAEHIVGKNVCDLVSEGYMHKSATMETLSAGRRINMWQYIDRTERYVLTTGTPIFDRDGNITLVVTSERDLTELEEMRRQLRQSREVSDKVKQELTELNLLELREQQIIAQSEQMRQVVRLAMKLAGLAVSNILLLGESGTGKGYLAKFIHESSARRKKSFIQINCAALPESLLEAELFGYEKGAFTGARSDGKAGLFELAQQGTLFLDEIGDLPLALQAKLLKYLDDQEIMHIGGLKPIKIDCTVIAATNVDLESSIRDGKFRRDLYYRLNAFTVRIPPLRERREDIFELTNFFLQRYNRTYNLNKRLTPRAFEILQKYSFPGNIRELKNILRNAVVLGSQDLLGEKIFSYLGGREYTVPGELVPEPLKPQKLDVQLAQLEKRLLKDALKRNKTTRKIARHLGISQSRVMRLLSKHGLKVESSRK